MGTLSEKNPESQENILLRIPMLLNYAEGLESYFQEQYIRLFIFFFLKNDKGFEVYCWHPHGEFLSHQMQYYFTIYSTMYVNTLTPK